MELYFKQFCISYLIFSPTFSEVLNSFQKVEQVLI